MECNVMYEDSMKMYIAEVVRGERHIVRCNFITSNGETFPFRGHASIVSNSTLTTASSQVLCGKDDGGSTGDGLFLETNIHQLEFDLDSPVFSNTSKVVCMVKETFPIREIWIKGRKMWMAVGMVVLCDSSGYEVKLTMWGKQCKNLLFLSNGSMICMENVCRSDFHGHSTLTLKKGSILLNLGHISGVNSMVDSKACSRFLIECRKLTKKYPCISDQRILRRLAEHRPVCFSSFSELMPCSISHIRCKIATLCMTRTDAHSNKPFKIILSSREKVDHISLYLHGSAKLWRKKLVLQRTMVWEFFFLAVCTSQSESLELHTTIISSARPLFDCDDVATECQTQNVNVSNFKDLLKLAGREFTGTVELDGIATKNILIHFGTRRVLLIASCSTRVVQNCAEKCLKLLKKINVTVVAMCYFESDKFKQLLQIRINAAKHKARDLSKLLESFLGNRNTVTVKRINEYLVKEELMEGAMEFDFIGMN